MSDIRHLPDFEFNLATIYPHDGDDTCGGGPGEGGPTGETDG